jgi:hypothetical protein
MQLKAKTIIKKSDLPEIKKSLPPSLARRVPVVYQLAYSAVKKTIESPTLDHSEKPQAIICVSALGCLNETISFLDKLDNDGLGSPKDFVFSTHNSLGGMLAKEFKITGTSFTICDRSIDSATEVAEIINEKTILIVEFDDSNEFAKGILQESADVSEAFAIAYLYSK